MAGTSRRSSSEVGPDLSPTPPKKSRFFGVSSEGTSKGEHDLSKEELECVEKLASSLAASLAENAIGLISGNASKIKALRISEDALNSTKQLIQSSLDGPSKLMPSSSREEQFGSFETIVQMGFSGREEFPIRTISMAESEHDLHIEASLLGEDAVYQHLSLIGNGAYGTVYSAKDKNTGHVVALKKVRLPLTPNGLPTSTLREIATLKQLERFEHPHIVRLLDVCQGNYLHFSPDDEALNTIPRGLTLWLVFEHVEQDLETYIASCRETGISPHLVKQMSKEIVRGVEFLHSHRIIHRDLKPQNILVSKEGMIKIADFGLAKTYDFEMRLTSVVVTQWYRSPEVLLGCSYATPIDIWSVGCVLAELNRLEPLFPGTSEGDQLDRIFQIIGTPSQEDWPESVSLSYAAFPYRQPKPLAAIIPDLNEQGLDLIKNMLTFDPHKRLTAARALRHRYFTEDES
ncbi:cyclin-dependent kinase 4-like isoform X2 [Ceratina calcarata]|nr:cyclin-dependent kinase 4-like isoform X2 [Ceratina calcarata]XP_026666753.1 cyclin-dependent kinase 4-like isoform X2 [Ceratina calcarata]